MVYPSFSLIIARELVAHLGLCNVQVLRKDEGIELSLQRDYLRVIVVILLLRLNYVERMIELIAAAMNVFFYLDDTYCILLVARNRLMLHHAHP